MGWWCSGVHVRLLALAVFTILRVGVGWWCTKWSTCQTLGTGSCYHTEGQCGLAE